MSKLKYLLFAFLFISLGWKSTKSNNNENTHIPNLLTCPTNIDLLKSIDSNGALHKTFNEYFSLKDALVKSDPITASNKANDLNLTLKAIDLEKLNIQEKTFFVENKKNLENILLKLSATKDISKQRMIFSELSSNLYTLLKICKPAQSVYWQRCPMANNGKGANWLSKNKEIKNPYFGSSMLTCGSTIETIQP